VPKERIEIFGDGIVIEIDDYNSIAISRGGKTRRRKAKQDKGQEALVRAFFEACRGRRDAPIPLDDLEAVSAASLKLAGR
jgi:polar amino acid transport system substrate-binding protein